MGLFDEIRAKIARNDYKNPYNDKKVKKKIKNGTITKEWLEKYLKAHPSIYDCEFDDEMLRQMDFLLTHHLEVDVNYQKGLDYYKLNLKYNPPKIYFERSAANINFDDLDKEETDTEKQLKEKILNEKAVEKAKEKEHIMHIASYNSNVNYSFSDKLLYYLGKKDMKDAELYNKAGIQRQTFHKIKTIKGYIPRRNTVFMFILILQLNEEEATELLSLAGYAFNPSSKKECYLLDCIRNKYYDINQINENLYDICKEII